MSQRTYLSILKFGVYLSLIAVFFVFKNLLFPYITSKQIAFNILIELLFIIWIAFIIKYPEYRPKKSWTSVGLVSFFAITVVSCFTGVDFNLSFWGDVERMLGAFHIIHFLAFYFIVITVMREWRDWKLLFIFSIICAAFVSYISLTVTPFSTIGNTAYVAGYFIINIYLCLILFFRENHKILKWLYLLPLLILLPGFDNVDTTGAYVGFGFSLIVMFFLYGLLYKNKKIKIATLFLGVLASTFVLYFFILERDNFLTQRSDYFHGLVTQVNLNKNTFQTRLVSWRAALKGIKERPVLGVGHGNYAVVFDKHFNAEFYNYSRGETYFDRAHNNILDIAVTTGLTGLVAYLSIFLAIMYYLFRGLIRKKISQHEFIMLFCLLTAYFVQNLAVFDSFVTYMGFMMVLGYIFWLDRDREEDDFSEEEELNTEHYYILGGLSLFALIAASSDKIEMLAGNNVKMLWLFIGTAIVYAAFAIIMGNTRWEKEEGDRDLENKEIYAIAGAGLILIIIMFQFNIKPLKMLIKTIDGQRAWAMGEVEKTIDVYKEALDLNTVLDRDSRTSMIRLFVSNSGKLNKFDKGVANGIFDYNIELAETNVKYNSEDSLNQMLLAQILNATANFNLSDKEKFAYYSGRALEAINKAIAASPGRTPIYFQKAQMLISRGDKDGALETLEYAATFNERYYESFCHLGRTYLYYKDEENGFKNIDRCLEEGGAKMLQPAGFVKSLINRYVEQEDWPKVIELYKRLTSGLEPKSIKAWIAMAKVYAQIGEKDKAREAAEQAIELDPSVKQYAEEFVNSL